MNIGAVFGGPGGVWSKIASAISRINHLKTRVGDVQDGPSGGLDVVFHVPGTILQPDYEGVRTGTLFRKKVLQVQIAVPSDVESRAEREIRTYVLDNLRLAVRAAEPVFEKKGIPYRRAAFEEILARIERADGAN